MNSNEKTMVFAVTIRTTAPGHQLDPANYFGLPQAFRREVRLTQGGDRVDVAMWQGGENGDWLPVVETEKPVHE